MKPKDPIDLIKVSPLDWLPEDEAAKNGFEIMADREPAKGREPFIGSWFMVAALIFTIVFMRYCVKPVLLALFH